MRVFAGLASLAAIGFAQEEFPEDMCADQCGTLAAACRQLLPTDTTNDMVSQCVGATLQTQFAGVQHDCRDCIQLQYTQGVTSGQTGGWGGNGSAIRCLEECNPQRVACENNGFVGMQVQTCVRGMLDMERGKLDTLGSMSPCLSCVSSTFPGGGTNQNLKDCMNVTKIKYDQRPKGKSSKSKVRDLCECQDKCEQQGGWACAYKPHKKVGKKGKCSCMIRSRPRRPKMKRYRGGSSLIFDE